MFKRQAGWIITPIGLGYKCHFFKKDQTMAFCGHDDASTYVTFPHRPPHIPSCKRCLKAVQSMVSEESEK